MEGRGPRRDGCGDNSVTSEPGVRSGTLNLKCLRSIEKAATRWTRIRTRTWDGDWLMEKEAAWTRALDDVRSLGQRKGKDGHEHGAWRSMEKGKGGGRVPS